MTRYIREMFLDKKSRSNIVVVPAGNSAIIIKANKLLHAYCLSRLKALASLFLRDQAKSHQICKRISFV